MLGLSNREMAIAIWVATLLATVLLVPSWRRKLLPEFLSVLKALFAWKLQLIFFLYFSYAFGLLYFANWLGLWEKNQLKDTIFIVLFTGIPLVFAASEVRTGGQLLKKVSREVVGISVFLIFLVGLVPFSLWAELLLQPMLAFLVLIAAIAKSPEHRPVVTLVNGVLGVIGLVLIARAVRTIAVSWGSQDYGGAVGSLALTIWLPLALLPFLYPAALVMALENVLVMLPYVNGKNPLPWRIRVAFVVGTRFRLGLASEFNGIWRSKIAECNYYREARWVLKEFRLAVRNRDLALKIYVNEKKRNSGLDGVDADGRRLDRREFHATKKLLEELYVFQQNAHRHRLGRYHAELGMFASNDLEQKGLDSSRPIEIEVRNDGQAWRAWRETASGWVFGVGGTPDIGLQWQYDGATPPHNFPSDAGTEWREVTMDEGSLEWAHDDAPPQFVLPLKAEY